MTFWRQNIAIPPVLLHPRSLLESSDFGEHFLPDMTRRIHVKPFSTKSAHREEIFREIEVALSMTGFLWDNNTRTKWCLSVLVIMSLTAAHLYLLKCAINYETLDFVLYGTRIAAASASCLVTAVRNERLNKVIKTLNEEANNQLPQRRLTRIRMLCRVLTGASLTTVLGFFTPPTYITFFTNDRTRAPFFKRCVIYTEDLLFVVTIWYQLCFLPSLFVVISHTTCELLSTYNDSLPRLFSRPLGAGFSVSPLCHQLRAARLRRDRIHKTFRECRSLYAPCLFFWYGMTFLGFCAELSAFTRQADSWVQRYYKILSCAHSWVTFWGVSLAANFVYAEARKTWAVLQEASLRLPPAEHAADPTGELAMLKEDVKEISLAFTIAGFYKLTLKAAFSVFSCMLTYAFVWYQIGPASNTDRT
ncbi:hypothetical protein HPB49_004283 [Dermacentor silvarum]|uniref:Uncharacterized protein n=1 Tax=Dermacentor silvarum TaxID=543639 RepID=A0ACB8DAI7_DERSI|nr:hypothetical protein HPB49_004283 [Dermacentor silvarum]